ncbi:hypothetical protein AMAG_10847 [Allomyces macrogynus ATCC 38327]|uniref:DUF4436 domain-containing protein n=1 Tax=Allomyces macrogynus (strain ATCC 38327) TaxID=578462 RepID=A0A0L0SS46_ALLM3|nr:hypothetical protein AMAG_10847 [Allomyces macrogynus ATCC 38327]|eukprot:KNE65195.1 hypothetical protein AMAG_10847 [Allomyces macrogynus ATCC 38327]
MLGLQRVFPALRKYKLLRRFAYLVVLATLWVAVILPTYLVYRREIQASNLLPASPTPPAPQFLNISARIGNIDPAAGTYRLTLDLAAAIVAGGQSDSKSNTTAPDLFVVVNGERRLKSAMTLYIDDTKRTFGADERLGSVDAVITFQSGSTRHYPFDVHSTAVDVSAALIDSAQTPVPLRLTLNGAVPGFALDNFVLVADPDQGFGYLLLAFDIARSGTTKGFSIFIVILSWCLSLIMGYLALQVARQKRAVEPPMLAPPCALLFALPSLRNVQPGVPGIGVTVDVVGFFWNMAIVAISATVIILYFILRWQKPAAAPTTAELPADTTGGAVPSLARIPVADTLAATRGRWGSEPGSLARRTHGVPGDVGDVAAVIRK